ncbi:MAG TPA: pyridoxal 5'-phosphate synthase glutaminase subunit PdxT [Acidimicrobiales bacterium]|jgi:5'-phosphate synthase pdxT subunit|nr:pyridoxal 5'-phosphate synthase glutaminase subunit PdxT [Acidimicrobiales bacterium]
MTIGILALQGDVREHEAAFDELGVATRLVRRPAQLEEVDGIVLPGGESTTLSMLLQSSGLFDPLAAALADGLPAFGTCAGLVLLSRRILDGRPDQRSFGVLDCSVRRNGYGRQRFSFEASVAVSGLEAPMPAVFIRAPVVVELGPGVDVLATLDAGTDGQPDPVACRQGPVLATAFHPELTPDRRLHRLFAEMAGRGSSSRPPGGHW